MADENETVAVLSLPWGTVLSLEAMLRRLHAGGLQPKSSEMPMIRRVLEVIDNEKGSDHSVEGGS